MAGESCGEEGEERGGLVSKQVAVNGGRNQSLDSHRLLSQFVVESLQTLVGIVEFPPRLLLRKEGKGGLFTSFNRDEANYSSVRLTHGVGGYGQTLLDQALKGGLQHHVLIGDGLLHDLLCGD